MTSPPRADVPGGPPRELFDAVAAVVERWLEQLVVETARARLGACPPELAEAASAMAAQEAPAVLADVAALLAVDVDDQRANPLAVLRAHVAPANRLLRDARVPVQRRDEFDERHFPDDTYGLGPATWRDVDDSLHEPGLVWGAWKAATVLARRREEGRR